MNLNSKNQMKVINLTNKFGTIGNIVFLRAVLHNTSLEFATIYYSINDEEQLLGLRIDLGKGVFLDQINNNVVDEVTCNEIISEIVKEISANKYADVVKQQTDAILDDFKNSVIVVCNSLEFHLKGSKYTVANEVVYEALEKLREYSRR